MLADDLRTSPTLRLHVGGTSVAVDGVAGTSVPQRPRSPGAAQDERGGLRPGEEDLLLALSRLARAVLPATSGICLTLQETVRTTRTLSDTALAEAVDRAQRDAGAGPSLTAHRDGEPRCSDDLREDPRWSGLGSRLRVSGSSPVTVAAQGAGPVSVVALPLSGGARGLGVLAVYGDGHPVLVTEGDVAQLVTLGVVASQLVALLRRASRG